MLGWGFTVVARPRVGLRAGSSLVSSRVSMSDSPQSECECVCAPAGLAVGGYLSQCRASARMVGGRMVFSAERDQFPRK